ncbi:hypothetical protein IJT17_01890, partial [bacterium]|nr:hypothetical protein [bacterium]
MRKYFGKMMVWGLALAMATGVAVADTVSKDPQFKIDPTFSLPGEEVCSEGARPVTAEEKAEIETTLHELYQACERKDVDKVMELISVAVEESALEYAGRHKENPDAAQEIRDAFRYFFRDILNHEEFELDPYDTEGLYYIIDEDGTISVASSIPIISSTKGL